VFVREQCLGPLEQVRDRQRSRLHEPVHRQLLRQVVGLP
jgi:hypothetical protein